uniref:diacylglycerol O-acyltransferase n=1 Tax=Acrobeloides nanus TaxID=290746 RepID=A0A914EM96_9BILA
MKLWQYFANYFPLKLVKTAELDPKNNYIVGSHPHGVLSIGAFGSFCTEATGFSKNFPGITPYQVTLHGQFQFPFRRELSVLCGAISSEKESIEYVLKKAKGNAISIVLGGAEEALDCHPDNYDLRLSTRKGFVKLALKHGAHLVPMYNFGENKTYDQLDNRRGTRLRNFQTTFKRYFGFSAPIFFGRGIFQYSVGLIPYRTPITTVVGKPIAVKQNSTPTQEEIDILHSEYCKQLIQLFDENKTKYGIPENANLNIY